MTTNQQAWRIAAAIAEACGHGWGTWAMGPVDADYRAYGAACDEKEGPCYCGATHRRQMPVDDPSDVELYKAYCARLCVEPGPLPSLSGTTPKGIGWGVSSSEGIRVSFYLPTTTRGPVAVWIGDQDTVVFFGADTTAFGRELVSQIGELARVAAEVMR